MLQPPAGSRLPPKHTGANDDQIFDDSYLEDLKLLEITNQNKDITAEQFVEEQVGLERTYSKTDLQQSCSQELAKELDLINGGFYEFQEKAFRIIGQYLIAIVGDSTTTEEEKQQKITELYEHDELYWILGQYGLKHVALIKLIEKLKHHSYGLTREQIKLLEKYGMPEHVKNVKLFLESQLKKMPPTTRQQKQDLIYKVIEVASVYNMSLSEEQWITEPEINALVESMSDLLYNIATVEEDRKQMLRSPDGLSRDKAIEHFSTHYISNMIKNDKVMTYSARLDHFFQMMLMLKADLDSISTRNRMTKVTTEIVKDESLPKALLVFKDIYTRAHKHFVLKANERLYSPEIEDLFFKFCLADSYKTHGEVSTKSIKAFEHIGGKYFDVPGLTYGEYQAKLIKYFLSEVIPESKLDEHFTKFTKVFAWNVYTRKQISEVQESIKEDLSKISFEEYIKLLDFLPQYLGRATGNIIREAGSAIEVDKFLVACASSDIFAQLSGSSRRQLDRLEELGNAIRIAGGKEVGIFARSLPKYRDEIDVVYRGEKIGRFIYAAGGGEAALKLIGKLDKSVIFKLLRGSYSWPEEERIKELGEEGEELARQEFFSKVAKLKAELISLQVGPRYAQGFLDALKLCGNIENNDVRRRLETKLLKDISYMKVKGKPCIVFPQHIMPHPWSLEDATPEEVKNKLIATTLQKGGNYREGRPLIDNTDFRKRYYYNSSVVRNTMIIPSNEMYGNLLKRIDETSGSGMSGNPSAKAPRSDILASLCNLGFPGIENKGVFNGPKLGDVKHTCCVWSNSAEYLVLPHHGTARIEKYGSDTHANTLRLLEPDTGFETSINL